MERGSNQVSPHKDDARKHELQGYLRSGHPTHAEETYDPEPAADDDVRVDPGGPVPPPGKERDRIRAEKAAETLRSDLARHLNRTAFPGDRSSLVQTLSKEHAPDTLVDAVRELPGGEHYKNAGQIVRALGHRPHA
ncbi:DUF2795 domain-containing protein [Streptomyces sp. NPDC051020]|uniref:DUF2795 domain-containing protein n=1 Tax=Streptomyces sp. NPDC051020 TaxID=3155409 RepID=UPI003417DFC1